MAISEAKRGQVVRVRGVARPTGPPVALPFTGGDGVYHATEILNPGAYGGLATVSKWAPFHLEDESGSRAVVAPGAELDYFIAQERSGVVERDHAEVLALLGTYGQRLGRGAVGLMWRQRRVAAGDTVTLCGRAELVPVASAKGAAQGGDYREPPRHLVLQPVDGAVVVMADGT